MRLSFITKLKSAGLPRLSAKLAPLTKERKVKALSTTTPKIAGKSNLKSFNFSKFTKVIKLPKAAKLAVVKKAVKQAKPKGY